MNGDLMKKKEKLNILYEDKYLIVIEKPSGLLTIGTIKERENTLYKKVSDYVKKQHKSNKIFIVHRLDKDTSGIILFAKNEEVKRKLQRDWDKTIRKYIALVEGNVTKNGIIKNYLGETKTLKTFITNNKNLGKLAITKYYVLKNTKEYSLLNIEILTGRKNQIRVHMESINHSIVGDKKYGSKKNPIRRLCLHANYLEFIHPVTNKKIIINTNYPIIFDKLINKT